MTHTDWPERRCVRIFTTNDPLPVESYESADYWDLGFRVGDGYGVALLSTGRLTSDTDKGLDEDRDDKLNSAIITRLVRPGDTAVAWAWYGEGWIPPGPKRRFENLGDDRQQLSACLGEYLGNPTGIEGKADFVLIFAQPQVIVDVRKDAARALRHWEKTLRRSLYRRFATTSGDNGASDLMAAEVLIGELAAKIGIVVQISPDGMDGEVVVFYAMDHQNRILEVATEEAAKQGRALPPNPVLRWSSS